MCKFFLKFFSKKFYTTCFLRWALVLLLKQKVTATCRSLEADVLQVADKLQLLKFST